MGSVSHIEIFNGTSKILESYPSSLSRIIIDDTLKLKGTCISGLRALVTKSTEFCVADIGIHGYRTNTKGCHLVNDPWIMSSKKQSMISGWAVKRRILLFKVIFSSTISTESLIFHSILYNLYIHCLTTKSLLHSLIKHRTEQAGFSFQYGSFVDG